MVAVIYESGFIHCTTLSSTEWVAVSNPAATAAILDDAYALSPRREPDAALPLHLDRQQGGEAL